MSRNPGAERDHRNRLAGLWQRPDTSITGEWPERMHKASPSPRYTGVNDGRCDDDDAAFTHGGDIRG